VRPTGLGSFGMPRRTGLDVVLILVGLTAVSACSSASEDFSVAPSSDDAGADGGPGPTHDGADDARAEGATSESGMPDAADGADGSGDASPIDTADAIAAACGALAAAQCENLSACAPFILEVQFGTKARCIERRVLSCHAQAAAPSSGATAASISACATGLMGISCYHAAHGPLPAACTPVGALPSDAPCGFGTQCASGSCRLASGTACSVCGPAAVAEGGPCTSVGFECAYGLECVSGTCARPSDTGGPCADGKPCWVGATCVSGACVAKGTEGDACDNGALPCDGARGTYCSSFTGTCVKIVPAKIGDPCGDLAPCDADAFCETSAGMSGVCAPRAADGAACSSGGATSPLACYPASACTGGVCAPFDAASCH
jgi:hypothetical protein